MGSPWAHNAILTNDRHMKCVCVKFVPRLLTNDQHEQRHKIASDLFEYSCEDVLFLKNIMTDDESWVDGYDPETKQQSPWWKGPLSPRPKKRCQVRSKTKVMLLAFFDSEGILHHEYAPDGQTINKEFYLEVLRHLRESVRRKRPKKWWDGDLILHHNDVPTHTSHVVQQFLAKNSTAQLQQLPYPPDLAPCDFFLFPRLKKVLEGH